MTSPTTNTQRSPWFYHGMALITVFIWSFGFLHVVWINDYLNPLSIVVLRKDIFFVLIAGLWLWRRPKISGLSKMDWLCIVLMSLFAGPMYHFCFAWSAGDGRITVGLLGLIVSTIPLHAAWIGWLVLGERMTARHAIAMVIAFGGVLLVLYGGHGRIDLLPSDLAGPIAATGAAMCAAAGAVMARAARSTMNSLDLFIISGVIIIAAIAPFHLAADYRLIGEMGLPGWWAALFLGIFGSGVAFLAWITALAGLPALTVATYIFLASTLGAVWGSVFRGETIGPAFVIGAALVLTGLMTMASGSAPRNREVQSTVEPSALPAADQV